MNVRTARGARIGAVAGALLMAGCAMQFKEEEQAAEQQPVRCSTAQGDLRVLQSEKAHAAEQLAMGVMAIYPASAVMGILMGTESTKLQVATGEYNQKIEAKRAEIRRVVGL